MPSAKSNVQASLTVHGHPSLLCTPSLAGWGRHVSPAQPWLQALTHMVSPAWNKKRDYTLRSPASDKQHGWCCPHSLKPSGQT